MKNILYGLIIIGFLATVAGIFLVFNERNKAIMDRNVAEEQKDEALEAKKKADTEKSEALKAKELADSQVKEALAQAEKAVAASAEAANKSKNAEAEKGRALAEKQEAEQTRDEALSAKALAEKARQDAESDKSESAAWAKSESSAREIAEQNLDREISARKALEDDLYVIKEVVGASKKIAVFCSDVVSKVLIQLDSGDKQYLRACESWRDARDDNQKRNSLAFFSRAKDNYALSLSNMGKLENVTKETERLKELLKRAIQDSIDSTDTMTALLKKLLQAGGAVSLDEKARQSDRAIQKKLSADSTVVECCVLILNMMDNHKEAFTPSQRARIIGVKKEIEKRLKPEDESALGDNK
jgi:hypothetical protein